MVRIELAERTARERSYWPALPKDRPSNAGDTFLSMTIFFTSARAAGAQATSAATSQQTQANRRKAGDVLMKPPVLY